MTDSDEKFNLEDYIDEGLISPPDGGLADVIGPIVLGLVFTAYIVYLIART